MKNALQKSYRHILCVMITLGILSCSVFCFFTAGPRLILAIRDVGTSAAYYFCEVLGIEHGIPVTVTEIYGEAAGNPLIPATFESFKEKLSFYWRSLWNVETLGAYWGGVGRFISLGSQVLLFLIPLVLLLAYLFHRYLKTENTDHGKDTKALQRWKRFTEKVCRPVRCWFWNFIWFIQSYPVYWKIWLVLILYSFNVFSIVLSAVAYYLYFAVSFDMIHLYTQIYKLFLDLLPAFCSLPLWLWLLALLILFLRWRKRYAIRRLYAYEARNQAFLSSTPIVLFLVGPMGCKKTTLLTDMALSVSVNFREEALKRLLETSFQFPEFPWVCFERDFVSQLQRHAVYNLATCRAYVRRKSRIWTLLQCSETVRAAWKRYCELIGYTNPDGCWGYDWERYGLTFDNRLQLVYLWDAIETYAQLYFIYAMPSSILVSNYAIREDGVKIDTGNLPLWDHSFFERDVRFQENCSRYSHILDFDALRLGRQVLEHNPRSGSVDFGVEVITEAGKERGNQLDTQGVKRDAPEPNQKNDLFNLDVKMERHRATVDNFPFCKRLLDDQRPESLGADARELSTVVHIADASDKRLVLPFFSLEELAYDLVFSRFLRNYTRYRHLRGDNTLFMHLYRTIALKLHHYYKRIYNRFGISRVQLELESGKLDGARTEAVYYLSNAKIYARRFATDCFSDYYAERSLKSPYGLNDLPEYQAEKANFDELLSQNSYFINDLLDVDWRKRYQPEEPEEKEKKAKKTK